MSAYDEWDQQYDPADFTNVPAAVARQTGEWAAEETKRLAFEAHRRGIDVEQLVQDMLHDVLAVYEDMTQQEIDETAGDPPLL